MAEEAQQRADGLALGGSHLRVSFCAPGPPGRSMLAALIAAQATVSVCTADSGGEQGARPSSLKKSGPLADTSWTRGSTGNDKAPPSGGQGSEVPSVSLLRPSIGAKASCLNPTSCSCSTTWDPLLLYSFCSTLCSTATWGASRVRWVRWVAGRVPSLSEPGTSLGPCSHLSSQ